MMIRILLLTISILSATAQDWRGFQFDDSTRAVRPPNTFMKANSLTVTNRQTLSGTSVNVDTTYAEHYWSITADGTFALTNEGSDNAEVQTVHLVINADQARNVTNTTDTLVAVGRWGNLVAGLNTLTFVRVNTSWLVYQDTALIEADQIVGLVDAEVTIASDTTTELDSTDSFFVSITGTTAITSFGTATSGLWKAGRFTGALTLTHNATSLILPGAANITTAAGDRFMAKSLGSGNWVVYFYVKADGTPIAIGDNTIALGPKTTGNYADGDAEGGSATSGDSASSFFGAGEIERARGGTGADTSAYGAGLIGSDGSNNTIDVDNEGELEAALGGLDFLTITTDDVSSANLRTALSDEVGTGPAMFTRVGVYRTIYVDAGAMVARTTAGAATGTEELTSNDIMMDYFAFDDTTDEGVQFKIMMPDEWDLGTVKVKLFWYSASATTSHTAVWGVKARAVSNDDALDGTWGSEIEVSDDVIAAGDLHVTAATAAITVGGTPALGDLVMFEIDQDATEADHVGDVKLTGVAIQYLESSTESSAW